MMAFSSVVPMIDGLTQILDSVGDQVVLVLTVVLIASAVESACGIGAFVPGETILVLAAVTLGMGPQLIAAVGAATLGAFIGDHIGYLIGGKLGERMAETRVVRSIGVDRWYQATEFVQRRGFWIIVIARLLPGVRTLISAAAGAMNMRYSHFARATGTGALLWSVIWIFGGAALGSAFIEFAAEATLPALTVLLAVLVGVFVVRKIRMEETNS